jgi:hypothetical protein
VLLKGVAESNQTQRIPVPTADDDGTANWDRPGAKAEPTFVPGSACFTDFAREHGSLGRAQFLAQITEPHLIISGSGSSEHLPIMTQVADDGQLRKELEAVRIVPLRKGENTNSFSMMITIGRTDNNDIVIKHSMLSKFHAYFRNLGKWSVTDGGSLNGTVLDGRKLPPERTFPVASGTTIVMGRAVTLQFLEPNELFDVVQDVL